MFLPGKYRYEKNAVFQAFFGVRKICLQQIVELLGVSLQVKHKHAFWCKP